MLFYIHGSKDSLDTDILYVFDTLPTFSECQKFCGENKEENRNIITVRDGIVTGCFKGTIDEINNGLLDTYDLHEQKFSNIVKSRVERDVLMKTIRVVRCILSHLTRTQYREEVKKVIKSNSWSDRLNLLSNINLVEIKNFDKKGTKKDIYKIFAFQLGQIMCLFKDIECYTKSSIAENYPILRDFLYREDNVDIEKLNNFLSLFLMSIQRFDIEEFEDYVYFKDFDKKINLRNEKYL